MPTETLDALGRTPIADGLKQQIAAELAAIPEGKRGAVVFLGTGDGARMYLAAKILFGAGSAKAVSDLHRAGAPGCSQLLNSLGKLYTN